MSHHLAVFAAGAVLALTSFVQAAPAYAEAAAPASRAAAVTRAVEHHLRDLSDWLAIVEVAGTTRAPITLGLRN